jgi:hypothetical protein
MSVLRWIVLALAAGLAIVIAGVYLWQMRLAYDRIAGQSKVFAWAASASNTCRAARARPCSWCMAVAAASTRGR